MAVSVDLCAVYTALHRLCPGCCLLAGDGPSTNLDSGSVEWAGVQQGCRMGPTMGKLKQGPYKYLLLIFLLNLYLIWRQHSQPRHK